MSDKEKTWPYDLAWEGGNELKDVLAPYCDLVVIAGSLRRRHAEVGDIEILAAPGPLSKGFALDMKVRELIESGVLSLRPDKVGRTTFGPMNKYLVHVTSGVPVDIFSAELRNFGMQLIVRTGSKDWNVKLMSRLKELGKAGHAYPKAGQGGVTLRDGTEVECPHEEIVFREAGWSYVEPEKREVVRPWQR